MADTLQLGTINAEGDAFTSVQDLNSGGIQLVRDTFKVQAPARKQQFADTNRRYGGSRISSETHDNGVIGGSFLVSAASADLAVQAWESLLTKIESSTADYYVKWQPEGATYPVFYEVRGNATWAASYQWITFSQNKTLVFDVSWPVAPLAIGLSTTFSQSAANYPANFTLSSVPGDAPALLDIRVDSGVGISAVSASGTTYTYTWPSTETAGFAVGASVTITGVTPAAYSGTFTVASITTGSRQLTVTGTVSNPGTATIAAGANIANGESSDWAMLAWNQTPAASGLASVVSNPFGANSAVSSTPALNTGFTQTNYTLLADTSALSGGKARIAATPSTSTTYTLAMDFDPSQFQEDSYAYGEVSLEIWARIKNNAGHSATVVTSLEPYEGTNFGDARYTAEYGTAGKLLAAPASGGDWFLYRLGTVPAYIDATTPKRWRLYTRTTFSAAAAAEFAFDYFMVVPSRQRALNPTGKTFDTNYPSFIPSSNRTTKLIKSDLSGWSFSGGKTNMSGYHPDAGLGGQLLELPTGSVDLFLKTSKSVPDDPAPVTTRVDSKQQSLTVTGRITPRYYLARGS